MLIHGLSGPSGLEQRMGFGGLAERIAASLRSALELETSARTPVVVVSLPQRTLLERQQALLERLRTLQAQHGVARLKLVGHGIGGLDAYLLLCERPLAGSSLSVEHAAVRANIAHVVTVAAPLLGTTLALGAARMPFGFTLLREAARDLRTQAARLLQALRTPETRRAWIASAPHTGLALLASLLANRGSWSQLTPHALRTIASYTQRTSDAKLSCYVSYVPPSLPVHGSQLFRSLYEQTSSEAGGETRDATLLSHCKLLEKAPRIGAFAKGSLNLDAHSNDGLVNTLRQLPADVKPHEVMALVQADHAELLGYAGDAQLSLPRSHSDFGGDALFELLGKIVRELAVS